MAAARRRRRANRFGCRHVMLGTGCKLVIAARGSCGATSVDAPIPRARERGAARQTPVTNSFPPSPPSLPLLSLSLSSLSPSRTSKKEKNLRARAPDAPSTPSRAISSTATATSSSMVGAVSGSNLVDDSRVSLVNCSEGAARFFFIDGAAEGLVVVGASLESRARLSWFVPGTSVWLWAAVCRSAVAGRRNGGARPGVGVGAAAAAASTPLPTTKKMPRPHQLQQNTRNAPIDCLVV